MEHFKYAWLNVETGEFSNSWGEEMQSMFKDGEIQQMAQSGSLKDGYKIIKYQCLNDESFEFTKHMKLR